MKREALMAWLRQTACGGSNFNAKLHAAADMLAADAQEIDILRAEVALYTSACDCRDQELTALKQQEPVEVEWPDYHSEAMGCGLEDRQITNRYEAMSYGWDQALEHVAERLPEKLYRAAGAQQVAVPQGWQLVPVDPTEDMLADAELSRSRGYSDIYKAMLAATPTPPQAERVPMTETELEDGFNSPSVDVAPTDSVESVFIEGARFAERHHGIGVR